MKEEHRLLADFSHLFSEKFLSLALRTLKDPELEKPSFMTRLPGLFQKSKSGISYTDTDDVTRQIVPREEGTIY
jgi:hypothetical protein